MRQVEHHHGDWKFEFERVLDRECNGKRAFRERRRKWEWDWERARGFKQQQLRWLAISGRPPSPRLEVERDRIERERSKQREQEEARWRRAKEHEQWKRRFEVRRKRRKLAREGKPPILDGDFILHDLPTWRLLQQWDALSPDERKQVTECWIAEQA
jgi:hypothetical protein